MEELNETFWNQVRAFYNKEDGNEDAYNAEQPILQKMLEAISHELKGKYEIIGPIGRGGTGLVVKVQELSLRIDRALKIPRPLKDIRLVESVKNEIGYLRELDHDHIIKIYNTGEVSVPDNKIVYPFFIMDYIVDAKDIGRFIEQKVDSANSREELDQIMQLIVNIISETIGALEYLHSKGIIHFDIKPSNILLNRANHPIISDLGFAKRKTDSGEAVVVGFTLYYAHPDLRTEYAYMSSMNRVRKPMVPKDFKYTWDIYSTGRTLLEILGIVENKFPDVIVYNYEFSYLHLLGCRMLDGRNIPDDEMQRLKVEQIRKEWKRTIFKETWLSLSSSEFKEIKYEDIDNNGKAIYDIKSDINKLLANVAVFNNIQEINSYFPKRVQSSDGLPAPMSKRVKMLIEHPVFARLSYVSQLGLSSSVYPTATHSRLEHTLGTFRNCCLYIQSLIHDPYNPLFKQLVNEEDIRTLLVLSLIHDLGQYPLAHELEEYVSDLKHEQYSLRFLDNQTKDQHDRTIGNIIENESWGWGVPLNRLKPFLDRKAQLDMFAEKNIKIQMLKTIIDGPVDCDKLDYLIRDSQNCYLPYGDLIDFYRLLRNLTVVIIKIEHGRKGLIVGTYEKGQSAAESLTFARYLLYQSLYWHHTIRSIRTMLKTAVEPAWKKVQKGKLKKGEFKTFKENFDFLLGVDGTANNIAINDIINLIENWTDAEGKLLVSLIKMRIFYKRILTIHTGKPAEEGKKSLWERFQSGLKTTGFEIRLQKEILNKYKNFIGQITHSRVSLLSPEITDKTILELEKGNKILCDCPEPSYGAKESLRFVPEPERHLKNYSSRMEIGDRVSEVWYQVHFKLMNIASKGRVFCHPDIRDPLMAALGPEGIRECVENLC